MLDSKLIWCFHLVHKFKINFLLINVQALQVRNLVVGATNTSSRSIPFLSQTHR